MMRSCEECKFARVTHGQPVVKTASGVTVMQNSGTNYSCERPGGVSNLSFDMDTGTMDCSCFEQKEAL